MKMSLCVCLLVNPVKLIGPFTLILFLHEGGEYNG